VINDPLQAQTDYRALVSQTRENSTRFAQAFGSFDTTGWGEVAFEDCFEFGLTFIEEPFPAYSFSVELEENDDPLVDTRFPRCSGGIWKWKRNKRGFYVGAWCLVTVESQSAFITTAEPEPDYPLRHFFTFSGKAMKDLPSHLAVKDVK
jgi:hypothetical protein